MKKYSFLLALPLLLAQCITPRKSFEKYTPPPRPDYALEKNWAALPDRKDSADAVPLHSGLKDAQATAQADVFFIHPTLYFSAASWNADVDDKKLNQRVDKTTMREQASVFNGSCKVYAPRYREATLATFTNTTGDGRKALDTAYQDIRRAFRYYLDHYNHGRPIVIAGHSQGTFLAQQLLTEFFVPDPKLRRQLVAAYLIGGATAKDMFVTITPCDSASETGCYVAWHTRRAGSNILPKNETRSKMPAYDNAENYECTNPLTWKRDAAYAPASLNHGSVPSDFSRVDVGLVDAQRSPQSIIWIHKPAKRGYRNMKNYHVLDYNLFYVNLRENVALRVAEYLKKEKK